MEPPEIAEFARNFAAMARIRGPDPKAVKMRRHAFHLHQFSLLLLLSISFFGLPFNALSFFRFLFMFFCGSGVTSLSASAILMPSSASLQESLPLLEHIRCVHQHTGDFAVTPASLVEPFLVADQRNNTGEELHPRLIPAAQIGILVESGDHRNEKSAAPRWLSSRLLALVDVPAASNTVYNLLENHGASNESSSWDVGWSLAQVNQKQVGDDINLSAESVDPSFLAKLITRIAILGIPTLEHPNANQRSSTLQRGDQLLIVGSPFGILSPFHFFNSVSVGAVANCLLLGTFKNSMLMADIKCLPGMEGAPVFDKHSCLVGMMISPLRQRGSGAEIQLVITWSAIATALGSKRLQNEIQGVQRELRDLTQVGSNQRESSSSHNCSRSVSGSAEGLYSYSLSPPSLKKAISSVVLVTVGEGSWASGIVLNNQGLVMTNAHLLEPWRFGRTSSLGLDNKITLYFGKENAYKAEDQFTPSLLSRVSTYEMASKPQVPLISFGQKREKRISIRLDHGEKKVWCNASVVYISRGPLDVALLQMDAIPVQLCAIVPEFICPSPGASVYVHGHGLLGPRLGLSLSMSCGVISNVLRIPEAAHAGESGTLECQKGDIPVMLQTTAAVHPGASGGALINSDGRMIGLITSNAKHGGGNTIPHLNFSIPCKSLERIFQFAEEGNLSILEQLDKPNELFSSLWALAPAPSPFLDSPVETGGEEDKGSLFAKLLADKQADFKSTKALEQFLREKLPTKL